MKSIIAITLLILSLTSIQCTQSKSREERPQFIQKVTLNIYKKRCYELNTLIKENKVAQNNIDSSANELIVYIDSLKSELLKVANQTDPNLIEIKWKEFMTNIDSLYSYSAISNNLFGPDERNPIKGKWSARELGTKLKSFRVKITALDSTISVFNHIDCSDVVDLDGIPLTWEIDTFYHMPLIECLRTLTEEQIEIKKIAIALKK